MWCSVALGTLAISTSQRFLFAGGGVGDVALVSLVTSGSAVFELVHVPCNRLPPVDGRARWFLTSVVLRCGPQEGPA